MMTQSRRNIISCGMYAFTDNLQRAWSDLLGQIHHHLPSPYDNRFNILFNDKVETLNDSALFIGHTCGYPYITKLHHTHNIVCVPEFSINGCAKEDYSSWIVTHKDSPKSQLAEFVGSTAVINNTDSNSGMNVFRYEISKLANSKSFFNNVLISGSHITSMKMVIERKADLAAIDAATYEFAIQENVVNQNDLKIIAQSSYTPGLPFVISKEFLIDRNIITRALNTSLKNISVENKTLLKITNFKSIAAKEYIFTQALERMAQQNGYPELA